MTGALAVYFGIRIWAAPFTLGNYAVLGSVINPARVLQGVRSGLGDVTETGRRAVGTTGRVVSTLARVGTRPAPSSPLNAPVGAARRYVMVQTDLDDYRAARRSTGPGLSTANVSTA